jgi:hypothetical protein
MAYFSGHLRVRRRLDGNGGVRLYIRAVMRADNPTSGHLTVTLDGTRLKFLLGRVVDNPDDEPIMRNGEIATADRESAQSSRFTAWKVLLGGRSIIVDSSGTDTAKVSHPLRIDADPRPIVMLSAAQTPFGRLVVTFTAEDGTSDQRQRTLS